MAKNIVIVGFMGTGKTKAAKMLARRMRRVYVSTDEFIEHAEGKTIKRIFKDKGVAYFREIEKKVVKEAGQMQDAVIDAGGGVVLDDENVKNLRANAIIISLWASCEIILKRIKSCNKRPLLNVKDPGKKIKELMDFRTPFYKKADFHIDTDDLDVKDVVIKIEEIFNEENKKKDK